MRSFAALSTDGFRSLQDFMSLLIRGFFNDAWLLFIKYWPHMESDYSKVINNIVMWS